MINTSNLNEARKQILNLKKENKLVIVKAQDNEFNRKIFENKDINIVVGLEEHNRKDKLKQRDSGLNEVLCKLANENNIKIGIDLDNLKKQPLKEKAKIISRIIQNINLCKRTKTQIIFIPTLKKHDAISFMLSLKASTNQAKQSF
jgi:RNase P/RNase MRP subunit p30